MRKTLNRVHGSWVQCFVTQSGAMFHHVLLLALLLLGWAPTSQATGWNTAASLQVVRNSPSATLLPNGKVLIVGGTSTNDIASRLNSGELYDPATNSWAPAGTLAAARTWHSATKLSSGVVLVAGGLGLATAELYNQASNAWTAAGGLATARGGHTATLLDSGKVLVAAGYNYPGTFLASAELYDPATNAWSAAGSLAHARQGHTATLLASGKVLVVGGVDSTLVAQASAELYDPVTNSWTAAGTLAAARALHTATKLPSGLVLVAGGTAYNGGTLLASAELYDPATNSWRAAGTLAAARSIHTATLLTSGKVLVVGGGGSAYALATAELYYPATNTWEVADALANTREGHTATLLSNGKVLVAGGGANGYATTGGFLASTELYEPGTPVNVSLSLVIGWNLVANSVEAPISVATTFGDSNKVSGVWKWVRVGTASGISYPTWAFYSPAYGDGGQAYAASKGYDFLTIVNGGEGFWVNAKAAFVTPLSDVAVQSSRFMPASSSPAAAGGTHALTHGWNLIATGDSPTPAQFDMAIGTAQSIPPPSGSNGVATNLLSLWAFNGATQQWYFWAPSLVNSNGLSAYLISKGYLDFSTMPNTPTGTLSPMTGFWVNMP